VELLHDIIGIVADGGGALMRVEALTLWIEYANDDERWEKLKLSPKALVSAPAATLRSVRSTLHDAVWHNGPSGDSVVRLDRQQNLGT
jgi:hypothetical protein